MNEFKRVPVWNWWKCIFSTAGLDVFYTYPHMSDIDRYECVTVYIWAYEIHRIEYDFHGRKSKYSYIIRPVRLGQGKVIEERVSVISSNCICTYLDTYVLSLWRPSWFGASLGKMEIRLSDTFEVDFWAYDLVRFVSVLSFSKFSRSSCFDDKFSIQRNIWETNGDYMSFVEFQICSLILHSQ